jgi:ligand-binding sensor protein
MEDLELKDMIDLKFLQEFQDSFADATGMASITVDNHGSITQPSNFTDFCMKFTRGTAEGSKRCDACDIKGGQEAAKTGKPSVHYCHAGLIDFAAPIIIDGKQFGAVLGGQVLSREPDESKFRKIAIEIGIDPDEYIRALRKIRIVPEKSIYKAADLLYLVTNNITRTVYQQGIIRRMVSDLNNILEDMERMLKKMAASASQVNDNQRLLNKEIQNVNIVSEQISEVIKYIKSITDQTNILGFNALIQSAKAGNAGRGFGVVAQEIRKLSDNSMQTVDRIKEFTSKIKKSIEDTVKLGELSNSHISQQTAAIEEVTENISRLSHFAEEIRKLATES